MSDAAKPSPLTPRQQAFVEEYMVDLNATQAAIRAGYSARTADQQSSRLLANVKVSRAIASAKGARSRDTGITAERVLEELAALAFSDHTNYVLDDDGRLSLAAGVPLSAHRAISAVKHRIHRDKDGGITRDVEFKLWDKPGTLKLAGRHVGVAGFFEKLEVTGKDGAPLAMDPIAAMSSDEQRRELARMLEAARARVGAGIGGVAKPLALVKDETGNSAERPVDERNDDPAT